MPDKKMLAQAKRNLKLIVLVNILTKRTYLPLSAIYFVQVSGLSIADIGLLAAFFAFVMLVSDLPTGYLADRIGRARCIRIGSVLGMVALSCFIFIQNKVGVFAGVLFEGLAYGFLTGAGAALVHDSLELTNDEKQYSKIMSRSMAVSLLVNAVLMVLVPLTYPIDARLPFVVGILAFVALFITGIMMTDVRKHFPERLRLVSIKSALRRRRLLVFVLVLGVVGALYSGPADLTKLTLNSFGIQPEHLGWFFAGASLAGAALGTFFHKLKRLPLPAYAALDAALAASLLVAAFSRSPWVFGAAFVLTFGFWRYRRIIYQHYLLEIYPTRYKGTMYSMMNAAEELNLVWVPIAIAGLAAQYGLADGMGLSGLAGLILVPALGLTAMMLWRLRKP